MMLPLSDKQLKESPPPTTWDNTMRIQLIECPRKIYYFLRGYDYKIKPAYFGFGSAWHEILNTWYTLGVAGKYSQEERMKSKECYEEAKGIALATGLILYDKEAAGGLADNSRENLISLWHAYTISYPSEPWKLIPNGGELGWIWPMPKSPFTLAQEYSLGGSLDGRITWEPYGTLILENKTFGGWLGDFYIDSFYFSPQVSGYIWYDTNLQGSPTFGALINMASKKTSKAGATPKFSRSLQRRSQKDLDEFILAFQYDLLRFEFFWSSWTWPKTANPTNCTGGLGKTSCLFKPLCKTQARLEDLDPLTFPNISHRASPWEPWKREGEQE